MTKLNAERTAVLVAAVLLLVILRVCTEPTYGPPPRSCEALLTGAGSAADTLRTLREPECRK